MTTITAALEPCVSCKGTGKMAYTVVSGGTETHHEMGCIYCEGKGMVPPKRAAEIKATKEWEKNAWCRCKEPGDPIFWDDGTHPEIHKHHFRCSICGKITQIG